MSGTIAKELVKDFIESQKLTKLDLELINQFCLPQKVICKNMEISQSALQMRVARLLEKLGVENQRAAIVKALRLGLVTLDLFIYREYKEDA